VDLYISGVRQLDSELEKFFAYLKANQLDQETLVILVSDHGEAFLEHGDVMHGETQYDEELRVPLLLRGPGLPPGMRVSQVVSLIDIVPTVLSILGLVSETEDWDGMDLGELWRSMPSEEFSERVLFSEADHHYVGEPDIFRSARYKGMKLILNRQTDEKLLFDLSDDPGEQEDVSPQYPEMAAFLSTALENFGETREQSEMLPVLSEEEQKRLEALGYIQ
jgi:arylsulfatase A-like enzyme